MAVNVSRSWYVFEKYDSYYEGGSYHTSEMNEYMGE